MRLVGTASGLPRRRRLSSQAPAGCRWRAGRAAPAPSGRVSAGLAPSGERAGAAWCGRRRARPRLPPGRSAATAIKAGAGRSPAAGAAGRYRVGLAPSAAGDRGRRRLVADGGQALHGADVCINPPPGGGCAGRTFAPEIEGVRTGVWVGVCTRLRGKTGERFSSKSGELPTLWGTHLSFLGNAKPSDTKGCRARSPDSPSSPDKKQGAGARP